MTGYACVWVIGLIKGLRGHINGFGLSNGLRRDSRLDI